MGSLPYEAEHRLSRAKASKCKLVDNSELVRAVDGKFTGGEDCSPQLTGQLLEARRQIHRRTDAGEVQTVAAADIAVQNFAHMQGQTEAQRVEPPNLYLFR